MTNRRTFNSPSLKQVLSEEPLTEVIAKALTEIREDEAHIRNNSSDTSPNAAKLRYLMHFGIAKRLLNLNLIHRADQHIGLALDQTIRQTSIPDSDHVKQTAEGCAQARLVSQPLVNAVINHVEDAEALRADNPSKAAEKYLMASAASFRLGDYFATGVRMERAVEAAEQDPLHEGKISLGGEFFDTQRVRSVSEQLVQLGRQIKDLGHPSESPTRVYLPGKATGVTTIGPVM